MNGGMVALVSVVGKTMAPSTLHSIKQDSMEKNLPLAAAGRCSRLTRGEGRVWLYPCFPSLPWLCFLLTHHLLLAWQNHATLQHMCYFIIQLWVGACQAHVPSHVRRYSPNALPSTKQNTSSPPPLGRQTWGSDGLLRCRGTHACIWDRRHIEPHRPLFLSHAFSLRTTCHHNFNTALPHLRAALAALYR